MIKIIGKSKIELVQGDITDEETEAIVNAANNTLLGGSGVDGAIHRVGGPAILEECRRLCGCLTGEAKITTGGNLKARYVIHTVGPIYRGGNQAEPEELESSYLNSLKLASKNRIKTLSFPSISTGAYGYPMKEASKIALETTAKYLKSNSDIDCVRFVLFDNKAFNIFKDTLEKLT